jgi:LPXTG-site transpeptidase (sortase) family protein
VSAPETSAGTPAEKTADASAPVRRGRRRWLFWVANLMIVGGILAIPGYFLGSCGYTWLQQRELRQKLEESGSQMAISLAALAEEDFVPIEVRAENAEATSAAEAANAAAQAAERARQEAIAAAKAERDAQLAAFAAAADGFAASVGGKTAMPIGRIIIPSIGVDVVMLEGTSTSDLKEGPGHWEETPFPGQGGNFVVSGHRTTYGAPFFKLNEVEVGDEINLVLPYAVVRYKATKMFVVYPEEVETVGQRGREQISLAACHPIYSAKQRIVVQGDLTGFKLVESQD